MKCDESCILSKEHSLAASVDGQLVANAQKCHASEFGNGRGKLIQLCSKLPLPHPHLQIRQCRPDVPLGALGDLTGDGDGRTPPPREECRENLVFRGLEPDGLKPSLESFGQATKVEVRRAEECVAWLHPIKIGEEHVLRVLRASV